METNEIPVLTNEEIQKEFLPWIEVYPNYMPKEYCDKLYDELLNTTEWHKNVKVIDSDKEVVLKRKMAYMADKVVPYQYTHLEFSGQSWTPNAEDLKNRLNAVFHHKFNSVLLNLYENGMDKIEWHSDKEPQLGPNPTIGCFNLGATRKFWFRNRTTKQKCFYEVGHGHEKKLSVGITTCNLIST